MRWDIPDFTFPNCLFGSDRVHTDVKFVSSLFKSKTFEISIKC